MMKREEWAKLIDFTYLKKPMDKKIMVDFLDAALKYRARGVCFYLDFFKDCVIDPRFLKKIAELKKENILFIAVADFPDGDGGWERKKREAELAKELEIDEIDAVMNVAAFKNSDYQIVEDEIKAITDIFSGNTKVIIESGALAIWQLPAACEIVNSAGAGWVKTSTGFNFNIGFDEKLEHVKTLKAIIGKERYDLKIKMSGGLETLDQLAKAREIGADIFGVSWQKAVEILNTRSDS